MAYPEDKNLQELLDKWADHYGYEKIELLQKNDSLYQIKLSYSNGFNYHFNAIDTETIKRKIVANKPQKAQVKPDVQIG